jgi:ribose/xylose/arabinose/galactoside ABC-type transport system permease subunit
MSEQLSARTATADLADGDVAPVPQPKDRLSGMLRFGLLPVLLVLAVVVFFIVEPRFLTAANGTNISRQLSFLLIVAMAQMVVLLTAQLDMSVGANIALTSIISSKLMVDAGVDGIAGIAIGVAGGLLVGLAMGLVNGLIVARFNVPSFIVTIGSASVAAGIALLVSRGTPVSGLPSDFTGVLASNVAGVPVSFLIGLVLLGLLYVVLNWTALGYYFYAVGGGENAARLVGVPVRRTKIIAFVFCGVLSSIAGILLTARISSGEPTLGAEFVILSIAAAVLGGTSYFGGEGRLGLVAVGALFLVVLSNGMNLIRVSSYTQQVVLGVFLVLAVIVDRLRVRSSR